MARTIVPLWSLYLIWTTAALLFVTLLWAGGFFDSSGYLIDRLITMIRNSR